MNHPARGSADIWWIIIGAVLALIVLVVLLVSFTKQSTGITQGVSDCEGKGGVCVPSDPAICPPKSLKTTAFSCTGGRGCCLGVIEKCVSGTDCSPGDDGKPRQCNPAGGYCE